MQATVAMEFNHGVVEATVASDPIVERVSMNKNIFATSFIVKTPPHYEGESLFQVVAFRRSADSVIRSVKINDGIRIDAKISGYVSRADLLLERFEIIPSEKVSNTNRFYISTNKIQIIDEKVIDGQDYIKFKMFVCVEGQHYIESQAVAWGDNAKRIKSIQNFEYLYLKCSLFGLKKSLSYYLIVDEILRII